MVTQLERILTIVSRQSVVIVFLLLLMILVYILAQLLLPSTIFNPAYSTLSVYDDPILSILLVVIGIIIVVGDLARIFHILITNSLENGDFDAVITTILSFAAMGFGAAVVRLVGPAAVGHLLRLLNL